MREKLLHKLDLLNKNMEDILAYAGSCPEEDFNAAPSQGKWSPSQIINHLILSEKYSLGYCRKKLSFSPILKKAGMVSEFKSWLVQSYLLSPFKYKAPKGISTEDLPPADTLFSVTQKWKEVRKELESFLREVPEEYLDKEVYKHPFGGRLSLSGMLLFFHAHFKNHEGQIKRALSKK